MSSRRPLALLLTGALLVVPAAALAQNEQPAPDVEQLRVAPKAFKAAKTGPDVVASGGAAVLFRIDNGSNVTFTLKSEKFGIRRSGRCVPGTTKNAKKRCTRLTAIPGQIVFIGIPGENEMRISGRWQGQTLAPGRYRLTARATGLAPRSASTSFTISR